MAEVSRPPSARAGKAPHPPYDDAFREGKTTKPRQWAAPAPPSRPGPVSSQHPARGPLGGQGAWRATAGRGRPGRAGQP